MIWFFVITIMIFVIPSCSVYESELDENERTLDRTIGEVYIVAMYRETGFTSYAPFGWSYAYIFRPGTTRYEIEGILGFEDNRIPEVIQEGYTQMLFVLEKRDSTESVITANVHSIKSYMFYLPGFIDSDEIYARLPRRGTRVIMEIDSDDIIKVIFSVCDVGW